jgi:hypothetical protein
MGKIYGFFAICLISLFCLAPGVILSQNGDEPVPSSRGSIPEELIRPRRGETPRYATDMVIGPLGQGNATQDAYMFARNIASDLLKGNMEAVSLKAMNVVSLENYMNVLEVIGPRSFRLGGGRLENDGSVSFLVRFIGRELAITGEMYIRQEEILDEENNPVRSDWMFEDLILEDAQTRKEENDKSEQRFDFTPYHRFY